MSAGGGGGGSAGGWGITSYFGIPLKEWGENREVEIGLCGQTDGHGWTK